MRHLVERHLAAEAAGDLDGTVAVYTDDVEHDVVGWPTGPTTGIAAARRFYDDLITNFRGDGATVDREWVTDDALVVEHTVTGSVTGTLLGLPGNDRPIRFRMLHVFEFRDGRISRENVWLDGAAIQQQLT
jgi:steroid delta-isomerase-like uncharacterized protein